MAVNPIAIILTLLLCLTQAKVTHQKPYCAFDNGHVQSVDRNDELNLHFSVAWADTDPDYI